MLCILGLGGVYKDPRIVTASNNTLVTLPFEHFDLSFNQNYLFNKINSTSKSRLSSGVPIWIALSKIQYHCNLQNWQMTRPYGPARKHMSLEAPGIRRCQVGKSGATSKELGEREAAPQKPSYFIGISSTCGHRLSGRGGTSHRTVTDMFSHWLKFLIILFELDVSAYLKIHFNLWGCASQT